MEKFNNLCLYFSLSFLFVLLFNHNINKQSNAVFPLFRITLVIQLAMEDARGSFVAIFFWRKLWNQ
nr:MAG TPA: hypothetical protein [Caudoviricetes sp.]